MVLGCSVAKWALPFYHQPLDGQVLKVKRRCLKNFVGVDAPVLWSNGEPHREHLSRGGESIKNIKIKMMFINC
jgi:hypothetical protein